MAAHNYCFDYPSEFMCTTAAAAADHLAQTSSNSNMLINTNTTMLPFLNYDAINSNSPVSFPSTDQPFGDYMIVPHIPEIETPEFRDFSVLDSGELECSGLLWPPSNSNNYNYPLLPQNSGILHEGGGQGGAAAMNDNDHDHEVKVGKYSTEERKDRILRYLKKRHQRNFNKTIKYACRKTLADKRVRVRGRFAKNNEPTSDSQHQMLAHHQQNNSFHHDHSFQMMKYDEEYWLQAAMDNIGHFPYLEL